MPDDFLDSITAAVRPEPNVQGNLDCVQCREPVGEAHYDAVGRVLRWWCSQDHESILKDVDL